MVECVWCTGAAATVVAVCLLASSQGAKAMSHSGAPIGLVFLASVTVVCADLPANAPAELSAPGGRTTQASEPVSVMLAEGPLPTVKAGTRSTAVAVKGDPSRPRAPSISRSMQRARTDGREGTPTSDELKAQLLDLAAKRGLTDQVTALFMRYCEARAREAFVPTVLPEEFWQQLRRNQTMLGGLLVGLHPDYDPNVVRCLQKLHEKFGPALDSHWHLGLAFALVWGKAGDGTIRAPWTDWVAKGRDVPPMEESFAYYLKHEQQMLCPPRETAWPLLVHVADNDVPLDERAWVLKHYANRPLSSLGRLHSDPDYIVGAGAWKIAKFPGRPMALPNILKSGGVCSQRAYYANRVLKSLGVPSVRLLGQGHAWEAWVSNDSKGRVSYYADFGKYGFYFCPLRRERSLQHDFELLAAAMGYSYTRYLEALIGCHIYRMFESHSRPRAITFLKGALLRNPYCPAAWHELARACAEQPLSRSEGDQLYRFIAEHARDCQASVWGVFEDVVSPQYEIDPRIRDGALPQTARRGYDLRVWLESLGFSEQEARGAAFSYCWGKDPGRLVRLSGWRAEPKRAALARRLLADAPLPFGESELGGVRGTGLLIDGRLSTGAACTDPAARKPHWGRFGVRFASPHRVSRVVAYLSAEPGSDHYVAKRCVLETYNGDSWSPVPGTEREGTRLRKIDLTLKPIAVQAVAVRIEDETPDQAGTHYRACCLEFEAFDAGGGSLTRPRGAPAPTAGREKR